MLERPGSRDHLIWLPGAFPTHRFPAEFDTKSVVHQPVENAVCNGGIADLFVPMRDRHLGSKDDGSALIAVIADFQKVTAFAVLQRGHGEVIEHQHIDAGKLYQHSSDTSVDMRHSKFTEQFSSALCITENPSRQAFWARAQANQLLPIPVDPET